jgi:anti-anti-sigma factor
VKDLHGFSACPAVAGDPQVRITVVVTDPVRRIVTVTAVGDIDLVSAARLGRSLTGVVDAHRPSALVLDVARVEFLDAAGMTALVRVGQHDRRVGITLVNAQPIVARALTIVGLAAILGFGS